jgi:hypothetical protein
MSKKYLGRELTWSLISLQITRDSEDGLNSLSLKLNLSMSLITLSLATILVRKIARRRIEQPKRAAFDTEEVSSEIGKSFKAP